VGSEIGPECKWADLFFLSGGPEYGKLHGEYGAGTTQDILMCPRRRKNRVRLRGHNGVVWRRLWCGVVAIFMEKSLWLWRRKHEVMLESNTVLAQGRVGNVARRRE
jgi:hypothetical protein